MLIYHNIKHLTEAITTFSTRRNVPQDLWIKTESTNRSICDSELKVIAFQRGTCTPHVYVYENVRWHSIVRELNTLQRWGVMAHAIGPIQ